jgi:hypothetical protein
MYQDNDDGYTWSYNNLKPKERKEFIEHLGRHSTNFLFHEPKSSFSYCHLCDWSNKKKPFGYIYYPF